MTIEKICIAIEASLGRHFEFHSAERNGDPPSHWTINGVPTHQRPRKFDEDLNLCYEMEEHLTIEESGRFADVLDDVVNVGFLRRECGVIYPAWHSKAIHRCEAYLRAKGLWPANVAIA